MSVWAEKIETIVLALFACVSSVSTAYFGWRANKDRKSLRQAEQEMKSESGAFMFRKILLSDLNEVQQELAKLFNDTPVDRFLLLYAVNGELSPRWATAHFQFREIGQQSIEYVHVELDSDYVQRLRQIVVGGHIVFAVEDMPECALKSIYLAEGIKYSMIAHIASWTSGKSTIIDYCSFATHSPEGFDDATISRCRTLVGRLKGMSMRAHGD